MKSLYNIIEGVLGINADNFNGINLYDAGWRLFQVEYKKGGDGLGAVFGKSDEFWNDTKSDTLKITRVLGNGNGDYAKYIGTNDTNKAYVVKPRKMPARQRYTTILYDGCYEAIHLVSHMILFSDDLKTATQTISTKFGYPCITKTTKDKIVVNFDVSSYKGYDGGDEFVKFTFVKS